jgi:galactose mutarotase-like enzyme
VSQRWGAESAITIAGDGLTATVVPARGGKIVSLVDANAVEWLAQAAAPIRDPARWDARFTDSEMAGWDECAPSIEAVTVNGRDIPDHGDLWTTAWHDAGGGWLHAVGASLDYSFERSIRSIAGGLRLDYRAEALQNDVPFLWAAHPQFRAPVGSAVRVPHLESVVDVLLEPAERMPWSPDLATIDSMPSRGVRKLYADPSASAREASLTRPDAGELRMSWTPNCPYLGLWFDNRGFSREAVIAIEPSTGYYDSLGRALANGRVAVLKVGDPLEWSIEVVVNPVRPTT